HLPSFTLQYSRSSLYLIPFPRTPLLPYIPYTFQSHLSILNEPYSSLHSPVIYTPYSSQYSNPTRHSILILSHPFSIRTIIYFPLCYSLSTLLNTVFKLILFPLILRFPIFIQNFGIIHYELPISQHNY